MANDRFDSLTKIAGRSLSRRQTLFGLAAALGGALFSSSVWAAPRTCRTCMCGTGNPCNPKVSRCLETGQSCSQFCASQNGNLRVCGQGNVYHCPQGCA